jgi:hypothetical protein
MLSEEVEASISVVIEVVEVILYLGMVINETCALTGAKGDVLMSS